MIIGGMAYDGTNNNYENSDIRAWLNAEFINTAFDALQRELIATTEVNNGKDSTGYTAPKFYGNNTNDKVFLLSRAEVKVEAYGITSNTARAKKVTDYAKSQGAYADANNAGWWWLRTPAPNSSNSSKDDMVHRIKLDGSIHSSNAMQSTGGVVPAIWVNL